MTNPRAADRILISIFAVFLFSTSCQRKASIPFPDNPSGFAAPVAKPLVIPEAKPLAWKVVPADSVLKGVTLPFDFNKLPSRPFYINDFKPLQAPISSTPLNWSKLEAIHINVDTIKGQHFPIKKFMLPDPIITRHSPATKSEGTTSSILSIGQAEGLLGNQVFSIVADTLGSLWFGTDRGLTKYNGDVFETYNFFVRGEDGGLEAITRMEFDDKGNLWLVARASGLFKLNMMTRIVEQYEIGPNFLRMHRDHSGRIWLTHTNGLFFLDEKDLSLKHLILPASKINNISGAGLFEDKTHNLWVGFANTVAIINSERNSIRLIGSAAGLSITTPHEFTPDAKGRIWISALSKEAKSISLADDKIYVLGAKQGFFGYNRDVVLDPLKRLWIMDNDTIFVFDQTSNRLKKLPTGAAFRTTNHPGKAIADLKGNIWIGTVNSGVRLVDPLGSLAEHFTTANGLVSNEVWGIGEDKFKRMWLATYRGLNIFDPAKERLYLLKLPDNLSTNDFRGVSFLDDDHIFIGAVNGYSIIDSKRKTITVYTIPKGKRRVFWRALKDKIGNYWICTGDVFQKINPNTNVLWELNRSTGLVSNSPWVIATDPNERIWIGAKEGVNIIDPVGNTISTLDESNFLRSGYTSMILRTSRNEMVVCSDRGMAIFGLKNNTFTQLTSRNGLLPESMFDVTESNGRLQIGSENGMIVIDRPADPASTAPWRFTNFGKREGFPYNDYNQSTSLRASDGHVWWGVSPVLTVTLQDPVIDSVAARAYITDFSIMDQGRSFVDFNRVNANLSAGDTLWSSDRTRHYLKDAFPEDSSYLARHAVTWDSITSDYQMPIGLKLPHDQNSFNITFTNLDIKGRDKIVYRYILEGVDETWSDVGSKSTSKNYYNVEPGDYTFKVATRGFNGVWSNPTEMNFTIWPPWWKTWWAYILYAVGFGGAVWFTAQYRSRWLQKENRVLEDRVSHRTAQLKQTIEELRSTQSQLIQSEKMASLGELTAGIAHEIQNPLNFVNNFAELNSELISELNHELATGNVTDAKALADNIGENEKKIIFHGKRADGIVKGMLQHSRSSSSVKEPININTLADEYLRLAYHGLRAKDKSFNALTKTEFDESIGNIHVIPQDIGRVILNLITNAFYAVTEKKNQQGDGFEPTVIVKTKRVGDQIAISVKDNGNGVPQKVLDKIFQPFFTTKPAGQGTGLGLSLSYDVVKAHGGELTVKTADGEGAEFVITIPAS